jgi:hypothetical protein
MPQRYAGIQSQNSTHDHAAAATRRNARSQRRIFAQYHSDEYVPPHVDR